MNNPRHTPSSPRRFSGGLMLALLLFLGLFMLSAQEVKKPPIYNPDLDVNQAISNALNTAQQAKKHVLLMFGGNWCPWCHKLHELFQSSGSIKKVLNDHYILILVDVGESADQPLNRDLVNKYRVQGFGYPSLAVLQPPKGRLLVAQSSGILEKGDLHDPDRVLAFLKVQAPSTVR